MICPSCGSNVPDSKFCENCGAPLAAAQDDATLNAQPTVPADAVTQPEASMQPGAPVAETVPIGEMPGEAAWQAQTQQAYQDGSAGQVPGEAVPIGEMPGDAAWQAQSQQAYQVGSTEQIPPQAVPGYAQAQDAPQAPHPKGAAFDMPSAAAGVAPKTAFVLVIVGLVLSALFVTFLPGLICSIIGLVLNSSYNKNGLDNPRTTPTLIVGIIGIVVAVMCALVLVFTTVIAVKAVEEAERQGITVSTDSAQVSITSSGAVNVSTSDSSSASSASSQSASASDASASASSEAVPSTPVLPPSTADYSDVLYHDAQNNPTLYALLELNGGEFSNLLNQYGYKWDSDVVAWISPSGSLYAANSMDEELNWEQIAAFPQGAAGQNVLQMLFVEGYDTPTAAFTTLATNVVVEDMYASDDVVLAVVYGSPMCRYLVAATSTGNAGEHTLLLFTEESIASGLFEQVIGVSAGSTMDQVWQAITGEHIGGYING